MPKILVVDDSPTMRNLVQSALEVDGHFVTTAEDGQDGLEKFGEMKPDLIVADVNMPRLNGIEMITAIRRHTNNSKVPVVVLTTETSEDMKGKIRDAGANAWIAKPFEDDVLCNVVRKMAG